MKRRMIKSVLLPVAAVLVVGILLAAVSLATLPKAEAATKTTYTRRGDSVWFGSYPKTKATAEELAAMSATPDENGHYTSGKDKFVKVSSADPKVHSETADTEYIPFDDGSQPVAGATYYFKLEPIEWNVMVDDAESDTVKLVSKYYLDTHVWLSQYEQKGSWYHYVNTMEGVPEDTPANQWRYSEIRAWLNDGFLKTAFAEDERKSIYLFANTHTLDYLRSGKNESAIVNDYIAVGNRDDYDAAGNNGRPTDYAIVKGATWCYNKDHIYYWVNDDFSTFPEDTVRLYRHDEHEKCNRADKVEAVRPILYAKRSDAKILATETQKEEKQNNLLLIVGIVAAVLGAGMAIPMMVVTRARYKKLPPEQQKGKFPYKKHEVPLIAVGLVLLIGGLCMVFMPMAINGTFGGLVGGKLKPGVYVQQGGPWEGGGVVQVGVCAYRLNSDGTFDYTDGYNGSSTPWSGHGTYKVSGSSVTFVWKGNPMVQEGYTVTATVYDSNTFGSAAEKYKRVE